MCGLVYALFGAIFMDAEAAQQGGGMDAVQKVLDRMLDWSTNTKKFKCDTHLFNIEPAAASLLNPQRTQGPHKQNGWEGLLHLATNVLCPEAEGAAQQAAVAAAVTAANQRQLQAPANFPEADPCEADQDVAEDSDATVDTDDDQQIDNQQAILADAVESAAQDGGLAAQRGGLGRGKVLFPVGRAGHGLAHESGPDAPSGPRTRSQSNTAPRRAYRIPDEGDDDEEEQEDHIEAYNIYNNGSDDGSDDKGDDKGNDDDHDNNNDNGAANDEDSNDGNIDDDDIRDEDNANDGNDEGDDFANCYADNCKPHLGDRCKLENGDMLMYEGEDELSDEE